MSQRLYRYSCCCAGGSRAGLLVAESRAQALRRAGEGGALVWRLAPLRLPSARWYGRLFPARLDPESLERVTWNLGVSLSSGVPLEPALRQLIENERAPARVEVLARLWWGAQSGATLSEAMAALGDTFAPWYRATLAAADGSGTLAPLMQGLAGLLRDFASTRRKLRASLTYPVLLLVVGSLICLGMLLEVVPRFAELLGEKAPPSARMLIDLSAALRGAQPADLLLGLAVLAPLALLAVRLAPLAMRLPPLRAWSEQLSLARCAAVLGALLSARVPLEQALRLTAPCAPYRPVELTLRRVAAAIARGWSLEQALAASGLPRLWAQSCAPGQDVQALGGAFERLAQRHAEEVHNRTLRVQRTLEPALVLLFGGLLGGMMVMLYAPVLSLGANL